MTSFWMAGPVAVLHIRDADHRRDERCGELRDVVYDDVRRPLLNDLEQVIRTRLQLDPDEELGEDEGADLRRRKRGSTFSNATGKRLHGVRGQPDAKRREAFRFGFAGDGFARRERHVMSRFSQGTCEWQHRPKVTCQRSAGQERTHRTRLSGARWEAESLGDHGRTGARTCSGARARSPKCFPLGQPRTTRDGTATRR